MRIIYSIFEKYVFCLVLTSILFLSGCSTPKAPPTPTRPLVAPLRVITIDPVVKIPEKPFVQMPSQVWGMAMLGRYNILLRTGNVNLQTIVVDSFKKAILESPRKISISDSPSEIKIQLEIVFYGIHGAGPFSLTSLEPMLGIQAYLNNPDGSLAWVNAEIIKFPTSAEVASHSMDEYVLDPKLLVAGYKSLADIIAKRIVDRFPN
jgi:hypothetical protein